MGVKPKDVSQVDRKKTNDISGRRSTYVIHAFGTRALHLAFSISSELVRFFLIFVEHIPALSNNTLLSMVYVPCIFWAATRFGCRYFCQRRQVVVALEWFDQTMPGSGGDIPNSITDPECRQQTCADGASLARRRSRFFSPRQRRSFFCQNRQRY